MWGIIHLTNGDTHAGNIESRFHDLIIVEHPVAVTATGTPRTILIRHRDVRLIVPCGQADAIRHAGYPPDTAA